MSNTDHTTDALARFRQFLHQKSLRLTGVRESVIRAALARNGHFDVDELVAYLRAQYLEVSRATVYRMLPLLLESGILQPTVSTGKQRCYERAIGQEHHDHIICQQCGKIVEFHFEAFEVLQLEVAAKYGFQLTGHSHELFGICTDCVQPAAVSSLKS